MTVLTSDASAADTRDLVTERMRMAFDADCVGVVCAAPDLDADASGLPMQLIRAVPGVRLPGDSTDDQRRVASPGQALASGADLLVVGRPVTRAEDSRSSRATPAPKPRTAAGRRSGSEHTDMNDPVEAATVSEGRCRGPATATAIGRHDARLASSSATDRNLFRDC